MSFISNLFSEGASKLVSTVGQVLDDTLTSKEEKLQLENELKQAEWQYQIEAKKLEVTEQKIYLDDIAQARVSQVQIQTSENATGLNKNISSYGAKNAYEELRGMYEGQGKAIKTDKNIKALVSKLG